MSNEKKQIIEGILSEAEADAAQIVNSAESEAADRLAGAEQQADRISADSSAAADEQVRRIENAAVTKIESAVRRIRLESREGLYRILKDLAADELQRRMLLPKYKDTLLWWIVEAALGLQASSVEINSTFTERALIAPILADAEKAVADLGSQVCITLSSEPPLTQPGILAVSKDGKTAFNNQAENRIQRCQKEIRKLISDQLFFRIHNDRTNSR